MIPRIDTVAILVAEGDLQKASTHVRVRGTYRWTLVRPDRDERLQFEKARFADAADVHQLLDLFGEDSQLNVYRGELEVRPPGAPTSCR